jgi:hypothetical protein
MNAVTTDALTKRFGHAYAPERPKGRAIGTKAPGLSARSSPTMRAWP